MNRTIATVYQSSIIEQLRAIDSRRPNYIPWERDFVNRMLGLQSRDLAMWYHERKLSFDIINKYRNL